MLNSVHLASSASLAARISIAAPLTLNLTVVLWYYPLPPWILGAGLLFYAVVLWRWPVAFLLVLPCVLPAWDGGLWTGWMMIGEADLFVMATVAVLLIRRPPAPADLLPAGAVGLVLLILTTAWTIAAILGLCSPLGLPPSDNAFLRPDNALRLAKGLVEALVLLPFLRQRHRLHGDAVLWFGWGMAASIGLVTLIVLAERSLFSGLFDVSGDYRVSGPFSSMRVGGGHIGAYLVLALPMTVCLSRLPRRRIGNLLLVSTGLLGGYALIVTFARTGYVAAAVALAITGIGWAWTSRRRHRPAISGMVVPLLLALSLGLVAGSTGMKTRFANVAQDFLTREDNWRAGLAVRDPGWAPALFGMGLGTYQRAMLQRSSVSRPSDLVIRHDLDGAYVAMRVESPFFLGQKISFPTTGDLHLTLLARSPDEQSTIGVLLCDKVLLYSDNCRGDRLTLTESNVWRNLVVTLPSAGLGSGAWLGLIHRPVELSVYGGPAGHHVDIRDVHLTDRDGYDAVRNGNFAHGLDRWIFTDDSHVSWRMLNQYLMLWFETGIFGLSAFLALSGLALIGALRAVRERGVTGAAVVGSIIGFLMCGLFDNPLEAPRLATLFFLVCWCGLVQWESRRPGTQATEVRLNANID